MLTGGYLKDLPLPHRRKFPGEELRSVWISVSRYSAVGGCHYYVSIREENNPIWDPRTNGERNSDFLGTAYGDKIVGWHRAWDDEEGNGKAGESSSHQE